MRHSVTPPSGGTFSSWRTGPGRTSRGSTKGWAKSNSPRHEHTLGDGSAGGSGGHRVERKPTTAANSVLGGLPAG